MTLGWCRRCRRQLTEEQIRFRHPAKPGVSVQRVRVRCGSCGEQQTRHAPVEATA